MAIGTNSWIFAGVTAVAAVMIAGSANASAAGPPDVTGKKFGDAAAAISGAGFRPVVRTTMGDRLPRLDCVVTNAVARIKNPPANTQGAAVNQVLLSLNCDAGVASARTPGYSVASPQGRAAVASATASPPAG